MTMKHTYKFFVGIAIVVGVFFGTSVFAVEIQSNQDYDHDQCYSNGNTVSSCPQDGQLSSTAIQKVDFPEGQSIGLVEIDSVEIYIHEHTNGVSSDQEFVVTLLDNASSTIATSVTVTGPNIDTGWEEFDFSPNYTFNPDGSGNTVPEYIQIERSCTGTCDGKWNVGVTDLQYGTPFYQNFTATTTGGFPELYPGYQWGWTGVLQDSSNVTKQLEFKINAPSLQTITIDVPVDQQQYNSFITAQGQCTTDFTLNVYDGGFATGTPELGQSISCQSNSWTYPLGTLNQGYWTLLATTSGAYALSTYFSINQSFDDPVFDDNPLDGEEGADEDYWSQLRTWAAERLNLRPYSYVPQIIGSMYTAFDNASSTDWVADITVPTYEGDVTIPGIKSTIFDDVGSDFKSDVRGFSTFVIYAAFIFYLWRIRFRFL